MARPAINNRDGDQFMEISRIRKELDGDITYSSFRNYQEGSVYVERSGQIIGLCFDMVKPEVLMDLKPTAECFPYLQDLVIRATSLDSLPEWVATFPQVKNLILKSLDLPSLGDTLNTLPNLKFLAVPDNRLHDLPDIDLPNLFRLNLNQNRFESFPQTIANIENLIDLTMDQNYLQQLPNSINSTNLQAVSLARNQLAEFPGFIQDQPYLQHLNLSSNFITTIPHWLGMLSYLQYLDLGMNRLREIPEVVGKLHLLQRMYLQHNSLHSFPTVILTQMDRLVELHLQHSIEDQQIIDKIQALLKLTSQNLTVHY